MANDELIRVSVAARRYDLGVATLLRAISAGKIDAQIGVTKHDLMVRASAVEAFLKIRKPRRARI